MPAPCWGCPAAGGGPGTPLQSTPCRPCCTSQPCVQPRPRLRPTARPCGTTMLGPCSHVPCLPKTGAPGAGLGAHLCPRGRDSTQHELAQHTAVEGRKQRREGGEGARREGEKVKGLHSPEHLHSGGVTPLSKQGPTPTPLSGYIIAGQRESRPGNRVLGSPPSPDASARGAAHQTRVQGPQELRLQGL